MAFIGYGVNKYGTPVSVHKCDTCDVEFTICPPIDEERCKKEKGWGNCLRPQCASYEPDRDLDKLFGPDGKAKVVKLSDGSYGIVKKE